MTEQEMQFYCGEIRRLKKELKALRVAVHPLLKEVKSMTVELLKSPETADLGIAKAWIRLVGPVEDALKEIRKQEGRLKK